MPQKAKNRTSNVSLTAPRLEIGVHQHAAKQLVLLTAVEYTGPRNREVDNVPWYLK